MIIWSHALSRVNNNFNNLGNRFNGIYSDETVIELTGIQARLGATVKVVRVSLLEFRIGE